jgi:hypothetical protein
LHAVWNNAVNRLFQTTKPLSTLLLNINHIVYLIPTVHPSVLIYFASQISIAIFGNTNKMLFKFLPISCSHNFASYWDVLLVQQNPPNNAEKCQTSTQIIQKESWKRRNESNELK